MVPDDYQLVEMENCECELEVQIKSQWQGLWKSYTPWRGIRDSNHSENQDSVDGKQSSMAGSER